ncbi:MAG: ATP-binding protein [Gammaproteobacteria bacterium]|nr:ATP-binding protein [Gammaproteobacteria bacterium]
MEYVKAVRQIRIRYILALGLIALPVTGSYLAMQRVISEQRSFAELVSLAGHQSGLANRIAYFSLLMATTDDEVNYAEAKSELGRSIDNMKMAHELLTQGSPENRVPFVINDALRSLYFDESVGLDAAVERYLGIAGEVYRGKFGSLGTDSYEYVYLTTYGPHALEPMLDAAVGEYRKIGRDSILRIENLERLIWVGTLILLIFEVLVIFRPLENRIRDAIKKLQDTVSELRSTRQQFDSARKKAESANEAKSQFLATMTHELRTPMNGVLGMSELLSGTNLNSKQKEYVKIIVDSSESLLTIINDILDFSRLEAGKVGLERIPFNLEQSAYDVMALLAPRCQSSKLQMILDYAPDLPRNFIGDPARIRQIFFNLIGNAVKFTEQGFIQLSISVETDDQRCANIAIHVEDTGIGIEPHKIQTLFRSFTQADNSTTRKYGGTGLGLTITRELVTLLGGHIEVDSAPAKGSVFSVDFKLKLADQVDEIPAPHAALKHVMLMEPNDIYRDLIIDRLARIDVEAAVVGSASEIRSRLQVCQEHGGAPQIVIVSQEAILDSRQKWRDFSDGSLSQPVSWLLLGNGDEDSSKFRKQTRNLHGHTTIMQKPFTNHQLYYAINTSMKQNSDEPTVSQFDEDATDFTLSQATRGTILLVEDNLANQKFASLLLSKMGYQADIAEDGLEALKLWRDKHYDLILMDCLMPNLDGYDATMKIREEEAGNGRVPVIALTANASEKDRERCHLCGMDEVITKPYRKHELADVLDRWLHEEPSFIKVRHNLA